MPHNPHSTQNPFHSHAQLTLAALLNPIPMQSGSMPPMHAPPPTSFNPASFLQSNAPPLPHPIHLNVNMNVHSNSMLNDQSMQNLQLQLLLGSLQNQNNPNPALNPGNPLHLHLLNALVNNNPLLSASSHALPVPAQLPAPPVYNALNPTYLPTPLLSTLLNQPILSALPAVGASCHQCKTSRPPSLLLFCTRESHDETGKLKVCKKKYCKFCMLRLYPQELPADIKAELENANKAQAASGSQLGEANAAASSGSSTNTATPSPPSEEPKSVHLNAAIAKAVGIASQSHSSGVHSAVNSGNNTGTNSPLSQSLTGQYSSMASSSASECEQRPPYVSINSTRQCSNWICPSCTNTCNCAACTRKTQPKSGHKVTPVLKSSSVSDENLSQKLKRHHVIGSAPLSRPSSRQDSKQSSPKSDSAAKQPL